MEIKHQEEDIKDLKVFFNESEKEISRNIESLENKSAYISDLEKQLGLSGGILVSDDTKSGGTFYHVSHGSHSSHASHASHGSHSSW